MPKTLASLFALLVLCTLSAAARESDRWVDSRFLPGRVIVSFKSPLALTRASELDGSDRVQTGAASLDALFDDMRVFRARRLVSDGILARLRVIPDLFDTYVLQFPEEQSVLEAIDRLAADPNVAIVEPDLLRRIFRVPNDALWNSQWDKRIMGAPEVWDLSVGSRDIICAGIDTGVDWNHPDLAPSLWVNPGEDLNHDGEAWSESWYPGDLYDDLNGVDDDSNGCVDDFLGWDFIEDLRDCDFAEDCDSHQDNDMFGINDHGTHVAGIMAATGNNSIGVAGMSWVGRLMALRAGYHADDGQGYVPETASGPAILYAAANGAKLINMSYGGPGYSGYMQQVMNAAWDQGCLLFAASGNDASTNEQYPANYENVIAVNATDSGDELAWWSNRGPWTDLCAPGSDPGIMSTVIDGYSVFYGTSMASPNAAGAAALVWSVFPYMTNTEMRDLLFETAANITGDNPGVPPSHLGHGRIDVQAAVASLYPQLEITANQITETSGDSDGRLERGEQAQFTLTVTNQTGWADGEDLTAVIAVADTHVAVANGTWQIGDLPRGQSASNNSDPVVITVDASLDTVLGCELIIAFSSPNGFQGTERLALRVGRGEVLVVDDDGGMEYERRYADALAGVVSADVWTAAAGAPLTATELAHYRTVIWSCGDQETNTLTTADQTLLSDFLDDGRDLLLVGQNIDEDLRGSAFYRDYLHAQSGEGNGAVNVNGVAGDPVADGLSMQLAGDCSGNGSLNPSRIEPVNGGVAMFEYAAGGTAAVRFAGGYKVAYFACALEAACGDGETATTGDVVRAVLRWMGSVPAAEEPRLERPRSVALHGNYPNPFNPTTTIVFDLDAAVHSRLQVFDVLGRLVATLVDAPLTAGAHQVRFDGGSLASGVYVARLEAGPIRLSSKMLLVK